MAAAEEHLTEHYRKKAIPTWMVRRLIAGPRRKIYASFERAFPPSPEKRVLDLGTAASSSDPARYFFESSYPYLESVVACGLEDPDGISVAYPQVEYVQHSRDADRLPFDDGAFDVVFCSAVIEHVGHREDQRDFLAELLRVGRSAFVTTPNRWYPVETHTVLPLVHYLPPNVHRPIFRRLGFDFFSREENLNLLDRRALWGLLPPDDKPRSRIETITFLGLPSNLLLIVER
jgi:hypothetical protein